MSQNKYRLSLSFILLLLLLVIMLSAGCDSGGRGNSSSGSGTVPVSTTPATTDDAGTDLNAYLTAAIYDEYKARDTYKAIIDKFGQVRPFVNIMKAEEQHISALVTLFNNYGLAVPSDTVGGLAAPDSVAEACSIGVQAEIDNGDLYVGLIEGTGNYPDVQAVFRQLQAASLEQHLTAFQRCAN